MRLSTRAGSWAELAADAYAIRHEVFVREQGVPEALERDEHDERAWHVVLYDDGHPFATGRLLEDGHIGRVAVLAPFRGAGHGQRLMQLLLEEAERRGHDEVQLHAQCSAMPFYAALGFDAHGEPFMEAGIEHVSMGKALGGSPLTR